MKTIVELKKEIAELATMGREAALARNLPLCMELNLKLDPLVRELGQRSCDETWARLADSGRELYLNTKKRMESRNH